MNTLQLIKLENLQHTSKNWDRRTKDLIVHIEGAGNMWGGWGRMLHVTLHGDNSTTETGLITVNGIIEGGYNISRGANGDSSQNLSYYKGVVDFDDIQHKSPTYKIIIEGTCGGAEEAMCTILSAERDWLYQH